MNIVNKGAGAYRLDLTEAELSVICNCINEACEALSSPEFDIRVGASPEDALAILHRLLAALRGE
jgi:hypothetical protein